MKNELSIYAKHSGWDRPLVHRAEFDATIRNKRAEEHNWKRFRFNEKNDTLKEIERNM